MVKQKNERKGNAAKEDDEKDLNGLAILPINDTIDLKLSVPR
jgi:hypothetical protein